MTKQNELIKLSVSKSATFQSCKKKFHFSYILKMPKKEYSYHTFGRFAHRILELFHLKYIEGEMQPHKKVMTAAFNEAMKEFDGKITREFKDEAISIMQIYLRRLAQNPSELQSVISVEKVFNINVKDDLLLTGMIDRIQFDADGIFHVVDYKTSKSSKYLKDDTLQLLTYAYVLYLENPEIKKVRVSYIMLRQNCEFITKEFNLKEILTIKDIYEKYADDMRKEAVYAPSPSKLCSYCDFVDLCESGQSVVNKNYVHGKINWSNK